MCENADKYRGFQIFETLLVVLNVDGSSPSGHPHQTPVSQVLTGVFVLRGYDLNSIKIPSFGVKIR